MFYSTTTTYDLVFSLNRVDNKLCAVCKQRHGRWKKEIPLQLTTKQPMLPCWSNMRENMMEANYWETAKVFMSPGQDTRTGPSDTDPIGLLQLVINCKLFTNRVSRMQSFENVSIQIVQKHFV